MKSRKESARRGNQFTSLCVSWQGLNVKYENETVIFSEKIMFLQMFRCFVYQL